MSTVVRIHNVEGLSAHQLRWSFGLIQYANNSAASSAVLFNGSEHYGRALIVQLFEVAGMAVQDITLDNDLKLLLEQVETSRTVLLQRQDLILCASIDGAELDKLIVSRDDARQLHVDQLSRAVQAGEQHQQRYDLLAQESAHLLEAARSPEVRQRLDVLQNLLLPTLGLYLQHLPKMKDELSDLQLHLTGQLPDTAPLRGLYEEWESAIDELHEARHAETRRRPPPDAAVVTQRARRKLQQVEATLRHERMRIWGLTSHFPELIAQEDLLRLGAIDGAVFQSVLVERELDQYSGPEGALELQALAGHLSARHRVFRAEFGTDSAGRGVACVLKEYELDGQGGAWKRLIAEVEALSKLQHPHIVSVQAVFQPRKSPTPTPVAYVQLSFYANGDAASWRARAVPALWKRQRMLMQLAQALDHLHTHGFAHGDLKLENVLISEQEIAYLADFESAREQPLTSLSRAAASVPSQRSVAATARYIAPEMQVSPACAKPTAATDMYAYGMCTLLMCCDEGDFSFGHPPSEQLQQWSRAAASSKAGEHLATLLEGLLDLDQPPATSVAEALQRRMSAAEVLRHPFLNTEAEREAARLAREAAQAAQRAVVEQQDAAQQAAGQQRRAFLAEQERLQRQHRWEAAERQRLLDAQEQSVKNAEEALARENLRVANAKAALDQQASAAEQMTRDAAESASRLEGKKRQAEQELSQLSQTVAVEQNRLAQLRREEAQRRQRAPATAIWLELADKCVAEQAIHAFVQRRQRQQAGGQPRLQIANAVMVHNERSLRNFKRSSSFNIDPLQALQSVRQGAGCDTLLFHGCPQVAAPNIEAEGLTLAFAGRGMLGQGLYGAPDPRKSLQYCTKQSNPNGNFMFICRFNLSKAQHAGPSTTHRNSVFDEFCVYDESHVVVLWMLKLA